MNRNALFMNVFVLTTGEIAGNSGCVENYSGIICKCMQDHISVCHVQLGRIWNCIQLDRERGGKHHVSWVTGSEECGMLPSTYLHRAVLMWYLERSLVIVPIRLKTEKQIKSVSIVLVLITVWWLQVPHGVCQ